MVEIPFVMPPFKHQLTALKEGADSNNFAFFMDMGTGKSKVLIDNCVHLFLKNEIKGCLVLAPKGAYMNWIDKELPDHWPKSLDAKWTHWSPTADKELIQEWASYKGYSGFKWLVVNIEALAYERGAKFVVSFVNSLKGELMIAVDESTTIKSLSAKRTKTAIALGKMAKYRRILTGDPVPKGPLDLYSQCMFLSPDLLGFRSFYAYRARYCDLIERHAQNRSFQLVTGYQRLEELRSKISAFSYRVTKDECLDLPPKLYQIRNVSLTPEQTKLYLQIKKESIALFSGQIVTTLLVITQLLRLHQVVCGHIPTDEGDILDIPNNRLEILLEVIGELSCKVVIWATYRRDISKITEALRKEYGEESVVHYYGETDSDDRRKAIATFSDRTSKVRFFVSNPSTGRYGITLTSSPVAIYYSNSYNLEHRTQSEDRIHRIGQAALNCTYIDLVAKGTIDEKIIKMLKAKKTLGAEIRGDNWKEWIPTI